MTALTESLPVDRLTGQATQVQPGRALATAILWVFVAFGMIIGGTGRALVICAVSVRYGVLRGYGLSDEQIAARASAKATGRVPAQPAR